jgi:DNA polymerase-3 subunit delta'
MMKNSGRFVQSLIFTGAKGTGKHTLSVFTAQLRLCKTPLPDGAPCGECRDCRRIAEKIHPDVIYPEKTGVNKIYSRDTIRRVCADAYIKPSDGDLKIYIFEDFDTTESLSQNVLLKIIEDPPEGAGFIFTAFDKSVFLPTVLSRSVTLDLPETTKDEARLALREALEDKGKYTYEQIENAVSIFGGNIGNSVEFLENGPIARKYEAVINLTEALWANDEYRLLTAIHGVGDDRQTLKSVFMMWNKVLRDCTVYSAGITQFMGCYPEGARKLSNKLTKRRCEKIYRSVEDFIRRCDTNMNSSICAAALIADIM